VASGSRAVPGIGARDAFHLTTSALRVAQTGETPGDALPQNESFPPAGIGSRPENSPVAKGAGMKRIYWLAGIVALVAAGTQAGPSAAATGAWHCFTKIGPNDILWCQWDPADTTTPEGHFELALPGSPPATSDSGTAIAGGSRYWRLPIPEWMKSLPQTPGIRFTPSGGEWVGPFDVRCTEHSLRGVYVKTVCEVSDGSGGYSYSARDEAPDPDQHAIRLGTLEETPERRARAERAAALGVGTWEVHSAATAVRSPSGVGRVAGMTVFASIVIFAGATFIRRWGRAKRNRPAELEKAA